MYVTLPLTFVGGPTTGNPQFDAGFLFSLPSLPPVAWGWPTRVDFYLQQTSTLDRQYAEGHYMVDASTPYRAYGQGRPILAALNAPNTDAWVEFRTSDVPTPRPTLVAFFGDARSGFTRDRVTILNPTITYWDPDASTGSGEIRFTKTVDGVPLEDIIGLTFPITAYGDDETKGTTLTVDAPGAILPKTISMTADTVVTFEESTAFLPDEINGRRVAWDTPVFTPESVVVLADQTIDVMVWNRVRFLGGAWPLRQRQSLIGPGSWPLRQRQNGAHSGSWALRQRQTRT